MRAVWTCAWGERCVYVYVCVYMCVCMCVFACMYVQYVGRDVVVWVVGAQVAANPKGGQTVQYRWYRW